jgi:LPS export ABC transporter protein LptC
MQLRLLFIVAVVSLGCMSCENNIDTINALTNEQEVPILTAYQTTSTLSDSAQLKITMFSPELQRFMNGGKPYFLFPKGIKVDFYNKRNEVESQIIANYARYDETKKLWEARGNVICRNIIKNEQLKTEELYWSQPEARIYSTKFTRVKNQDGNFVGEGGFESNQTFTKWKLKGSSGTVNIKDENNVNAN